MDELMLATDQNDVILITNGLKKIYSSIERQKIKENITETNIKEVDFLRDQCQSSHIQLSLLSCQTLYQLVENSILQPSYVLAMFMSSLKNNSSPIQNAAIGQGVINLLLLDLKQRMNAIKSGTAYQCPFGLRSPQHPIITLLQSKDSNLIYLTNNINGICNHPDNFIRQNSLEFLRPVFLYAMCNPNVIDNTIPIWTCLLSQSVKSKQSLELLYEILSWSPVVSSTSCLHLSLLLTEAIDVFTSTKQYEAALDFSAYSVSFLKQVVENGHDTKPILNCIVRSLHYIFSGNDKATVNEESFHNFLLINLSEILHIISPYYLVDVVRVIKDVIETRENLKNILILNMIMDGLITRLANGANLLPRQCTVDAEKLIKLIAARTNVDNYQATKSMDFHLKPLHPRIPIICKVVNLCEYLHSSKKTRSDFTENITSIESNSVTCNVIYFILRALILTHDEFIERNLWLNVWRKLTNGVESDSSKSINMIYLVLYLLSNETDGKKQIVLLERLSVFSSVKENIPKILSVYRALATSNSMPLKIMTIDLHTKLWIKVPRTYQFLHNVLSTTNEASMSNWDLWEWNIAKTYAIREICKLKPTQHGTDLVAHLSNILNNRKTKVDNDLATSLALDAIVLLCNSHTVNIVSTWKALKHVFHNEKRPRTLKSLCRFFGQVPLLRSPTNEYEQLYYDTLQQLWYYVTDSDDSATIAAALNALKNYDFTTLQLKHMPKIYKEKLKIPSEYQKVIDASKNDPKQVIPLNASDVLPYIPGECWVQVLDKINQNAIEDTIKFITHLIENEIQQYRSGVYHLPEGRSEPSDLSQLHAQSPLRAIVKYCIQTGHQQTTYSNSITLMLNCLRCISWKFSKPIPPVNCHFLTKYITDLDENSSGDAYSFELKRASLTIASNQIEHSGSARDLIENYLQNFELENKNEKDFFFIMELFKQICNGITPRILAEFLRRMMKFAFDQSNSSHFENGCLFEKLLQKISEVCEIKCNIPENYDICVDHFVRYTDILDGKSKIYDKYVILLCRLPCEVVDRVSIPDAWNLLNFLKTLKIRSALIRQNKNYIERSNSLMWLNLLIDNATTVNDYESNSQATALLFAEITSVVGAFKNESDICSWLMHQLSKIQALLTAEQTPQNIKKYLFAIDVFMLSIIAQTVAILLPDTLNANNRDQWIYIFPEALWIISERDAWTNSIPRVFEFLYHLYTAQANIPADLLKIFHNTLMCCRNHKYFLQKNTWTKFTGLRRVID